MSLEDFHPPAANANALPAAEITVTSQFGARCLQPSRLPNSVGYFGPEPQSEDSLYLNVWTARSLTTTDGR